MQSPHVAIVAAAASQSLELVKAVPAEHWDAAPAHWLGYIELSAEQNAKPMVRGEPRQLEHFEKTDDAAIV